MAERQESNVDRLLKARAEIDEELRRQKTPVTILFTDVVGSTSYFDRFGDTAGFAMLQRHSELATETFTEYQGTIIKLIGDSVMAEFPSPLFAVRGAVELQRRLFVHNQKYSDRDRIQLRIGINFGPGYRHENDVYGDAVNLAARICKKTGPAQILISRSVRDAVVSESDIRCTWLGKVTLAGKSEADDIYEVVWTDTGEYAQLRQHVTAAFMAGDLVSPGLSPQDLIQPVRTPTPVSTPKPTVKQVSGTATTGASQPSDTIADRYEILEEIGLGGMGMVYKARDRETGETVALKMLRPEIAADPSVMERFKNELRVTRKITHRNVCRIYDLHRSGNSTYIAMEYVDGESLRQVLMRFGRFSSSRGVQVAQQICAGLHEAHARGVVHRDLKPENIMLDRSGNVKLMDFGIAREETATRMTVAGTVMGTPAYMAPEQAEGKNADARSDIYSLGLVMYEMFTGTAAFHGDTPIAIALAQIQQMPTAPRELEPSLPPAVESVILKCLEKDPGRRYQSVEELETALSGLSSVVTPASTPVPRVTPAPTVSARTAPTVAAPVSATTAPTATTAGKPLPAPQPKNYLKVVVAGLVVVLVVGVVAVKWLIPMLEHGKTTQVASGSNAEEPATPASAPIESPQTPQPAAAKESPRAPAKQEVKQEAAPAPGQEAAPRHIVFVPGTSQKVCQLTGGMDREFHKVTVNQTIARFGLNGTEYGSSFEHNGKLFFLFDDSNPAAMFNGKPNGPTDPPRIADDNDAIAFTSDASINPCLRLEFIRGSNGAYKNPMVLNPQGRPAITLRTLEGPIAGISQGGKMYVIFRTDNAFGGSEESGESGKLQSGPTRSVMAVSDDEGNTFHYLYDLSKGPSAKFINVAITNGPDGYLYFWGTQGGSHYRRSAAYFARKKAELIGRDGGMEYFTGQGPDRMPHFSNSEAAAVPLFADHEANSSEPGNCVGELSVEWNRFVRQWVMLYKCSSEKNPSVGGIDMRVANRAWGPWSEPQTIFSAERDGGLCHFIHRAVNPRNPACDDLSAPPMKHVQGNPYAPFFISRFTTGDEAHGTSTIYYVMSTWNPYNTVIMKTTIQSSP